MRIRKTVERPRGWRPRFSLGALLYGTLCVASVALIWMKREAWTVERIDYVGMMSLIRLGDTQYLENAPDGTRYLLKMGLKSSVSISDARNREVLYPLEFSEIKGTVVDAEFTDNDHITLYFQSSDQALSDKVGKVLLYRRFPEWRWGHLYRAEVWLALFFGMLTLYELWRRKGLKREVPSPIPDVQG